MENTLYAFFYKITRVFYTDFRNLYIFLFGKLEKNCDVYDAFINIALDSHNMHL